MYRVSFILCVMVLLFAEGSAMGQGVIPRAGRDFTFGIIEGPDRLVTSDTTLHPSRHTLTILSPFNGSGMYRSPEGDSGKFFFKANQAMTFDLPYRLTQLNDLGKTKKGVLVHTSQPANLVLIDSIPGAGDATQLYPDEALDTSYVVSEWGVWDDMNEKNHVQFVVTASEDDTHVIIIPSSKTLLGEAANLPVASVLMKGECYIVKADTSSSPIFLTGSTVTADKPVSVIAGTSCGYVPFGQQSCNELMDELIGRKWWGNHFFVQPLGNSDARVELLITSDTLFFATINGSLEVSTGKRLYSEFQGVGEITTSSPVEMHQLTRGAVFSAVGLGDPTFVGVLPVSQYSDTMMWNTPHVVEPDFSTFNNWAPIIYPTADSSRIFLDGIALNAFPRSKLSDTIQIINGSTWSAINPSVNEGVHTLFSPVPIFVLATGFQEADAYSFMPGTVGPRALPDSTEGVHDLSVDESAALSVSLFPNPSNSQVKIVGNEPLSNVMLIDPLGRAMRNAATNGPEVTFNIEGIPAGTYFVVAKGAMGATVRAQLTIMH